jgi:hypothetical protein
MSNQERCIGALAELRLKGFPIPAALDLDHPRPLAVSVQADVNAYVKAHGFGPAEAKALGRIIMNLTRVPRYQEAVAADLSVRVSLSGEIVGPVSDLDRHSAALWLHARAIRNAPASFSALRLKVSA